MRSHNKLEMDLNNVRQDKLKNNILLKPLGFVLSYVDSAESSKPYLSGLPLQKRCLIITIEETRRKFMK